MKRLLFVDLRSIKQIRNVLRRLMRYSVFHTMSGPFLQDSINNTGFMD